MNKEILTSRFFAENDKKMNKVVFPLPSYWWSRFYEYAWAAEFCKKTDVVLDAACGIAHPFKFYLSEHSKEAYVIDIDDRINDNEKIAVEIQAVFGEGAKKEFLDKKMCANLKKIQQGSITKLPFRNSMFDKVFCLSVLEHLSDKDKMETLQEFNRVLKSNGTIILTLDYSLTTEYSTTTMEEIETLAEKAGLRLAGTRQPAKPQNAIHWNNQLYCFRMALVKKKDGEKNNGSKKSS